MNNHTLLAGNVHIFTQLVKNWNLSRSLLFFPPTLSACHTCLRQTDSKRTNKGRGGAKEPTGLGDLTRLQRSRDS